MNNHHPFGKSHDQQLMRLFSELLADLGEQLGVNTRRDLIYIKSRWRSEGSSLWTITLPSFAKDFERTLEQGKVDASLFVGFKKRGGLPTFLQGFLTIIITPDGLIREEVDPLAVYAIRQICLAVGKMESPNFLEENTWRS